MTNEISQNRSKSLESKLVWNEKVSKNVEKLLESTETSIDIQNLNATRPDDTDKFAEDFNNLLNKILVKAEALKPAHTYTTKKRLNTNPWFDAECNNQKENLINLGKLKTRFPDREDIRTSLNSEKKMFRKLLKRKKRKFNEGKFNKLAKLRSKQPKQFWNALRSLNSTTTNTDNSTQSDVHKFYDHFKTLNQKDINEMPSSKHQTPSTASGHGPLDFAFTINEVRNGIKALKNGKTPGNDLIPNELLKAGEEVLSETITILFNSILNSSTFPKKWAYGMIIPIHKKGSKSEPENYRGIMILPHILKLFTSLLNKRLVDYLDANIALPQEQVGFRRDYRGSDNLFALKALTDKYVKARRKRYQNFLYTCFVDFSKAFDNISRDKLYTKLNNLGVKDKFLKIIQDMYDNDSACVKINNNISEPFRCYKGVKQGCMLSPTLFDIYLSDRFTKHSQQRQRCPGIKPKTSQLFTVR